MERLTQDCGDHWVWVSYAPEINVLLATVVGPRQQAEAEQLLRQTEAVLGPDCRPLFMSDRLPEYRQALLTVYGHWQTFPRTGRPGRPRQPRLVAPDDLL